jgi:hypothetical protein
MIGVKLQGRTGNQMFQYAFAYVCARKRKESFFTIGSSKKYRLHYFLLGTNNSSSFTNKCKSFWFKISHANSKVLFQTGAEDITSIIKESENCHLFDGYFQSERYFGDLKNEVKKLFVIKDQHKLIFEKKYKLFFETHKTIAVHIRRGDYLTWNRGEQAGGLNFTLPYSYIETILDEFKGKGYAVVFVSDDIAAVKEHFSEKPDFYFEENDEIVDLQILMNADVLCLSGSSFSWWGAWLNIKSSKQIFAPENWLGFKTGVEFPAGVICEGWQKIKINPESY